MPKYWGSDVSGRVNVPVEFEYDNPTWEEDVKSFVIEKLGTRYGPFHPLIGIPFPDHLMPDRARIKGKARSFPDVNSHLLYIVSERYRGLVEDFDPGRHRFKPLEILSEDGERLDARMFVFNNCARAHSVGPNLTIWAEQTFTEYFCSDEFYEAYKKKKMRGMNFYPNPVELLDD